MDNAVEILEVDRDSQFKLLPCPHCPGGVAAYEKMQTPTGTLWRVKCTKCGASTGREFHQERHTVQMMWNGRQKIVR